MWCINPTISGGIITVVGYNATKGCNSGYYQILLKQIKSSMEQHPSTDASTKQWKEFPSAPNWRIATVPNSITPVIISGNNHADKRGACTSDVTLYNASKKSWRKVDSLKNARSHVGIALLNNSTIMEEPALAVE